MADRLVRVVYWDANLFLLMLNGDKTTGYLPYITAMFNEMQNGTLAIATSELTVSEVAFFTAEFDTTPPFTLEAKIDAMWAMRGIVRIPVNYDVAIEARRIRRWWVQQNPKPKEIGLVDILHLATAAFVNARAIYTNENAWAQYQPAVRIPIVKPDRNPTQLPLTAQ